MTARSGTCPSCGRELEGALAPEDIPAVPWHFKLLLGALCVYLAFRLVQMVGWVLH